MPSRRLISLVFAARLARFINGHAREDVEPRLDALPDVARQDFARRVLEPGYLVQIVVVELFVERRPHAVELAEVDEPSRFGIHRSLDGELDLEAMTVQARALVPLGHVREAVRRLETK